VDSRELDRLVWYEAGAIEDAGSRLECPLIQRVHVAKAAEAAGQPIVHILSGEVERVRIHMHFRSYIEIPNISIPTLVHWPLHVRRLSEHCGSRLSIADICHTGAI